MKICRDCAHYYCKVGITPGDGFCRRFPPDKSGLFSRTFSSERCGEWRDSSLNPKVCDVRGLSYRAKHCLANKCVNTLEELSQWRASDLLKIRNFGLKCLHEVFNVLSEHDLHLRDYRHRTWR